jgi:putative membrane protein
MYGYYQGWGVHSFFGGLVWIVLSILVVLLVIRLMRSNTSHFHHEYRDNSRALDILKERYAKGEINKEEFEVKKKDIVNN